MRKFLLLFLISQALNAQDCASEYLLDRSGKYAIPKSSSGNNCKVVSLYLETDYASLLHFGSIESTEQWLESKYLEYATLMAQEGISTALTGTHIATGPDWSERYINDPYLLLNEFARVRKDTPKGRLKAFISVKGAAYSIAWIGVLQADYHTFNDNQGVQRHAGPYSVNLGIDNNFYGSYVLTHELGHNYGSYHTHSCVWGPANKAIDDCGDFEGNCQELIEYPTPPEDKGTIMSYCHQTSHGIQLEKGFGTLPGQLITNNVNNATRDLLEFDPIILSIASKIEFQEFNVSDHVIVHQNGKLSNVGIIIN